MLTPQQEEWIGHLSDENIVTIVPFDSRAEGIFQELKARIQTVLGTDVPVEHRGSSSLGIAGQDEIDVYIPVEVESFPEIQRELIKLFGVPKSAYPSRIRFSVNTDTKQIDVFLMDKTHEDWLRGVAFEDCCRTNPEVRNAYEFLKFEMNGKSVQDFYRRKIEFINEVLSSVVK